MDPLGIIFYRYLCFISPLKFYLFQIKKVIILINDIIIISSYIDEPKVY